MVSSELYEGVITEYLGQLSTTSPVIGLKSELFSAVDGLDVQRPSQ